MKIGDVIILHEYEQLPDTEEKLEIIRQYMEDEINRDEFVDKVKIYSEQYK